MIAALALDDEPPALKVLEKFCGKSELIDLQKTFTKPSDTQQYLTEHHIDLLFLDINMPSVTGIDFYKSLNQQIMVIFTTAYSEYAIEGFNLSAIDYLLKPYTYERFLQAATKADEYYKNILKKEEIPNPYLLIRADYSLVKILISEIIFIEGLDDYLKIHIANAKPVVARMTMKAILQKLPASDFIRVHRSFIVPFKRIEAVRNKIVYIGEEEIPIGSTYEEAVLSRLL
jgi:DNA-binding LytR/AlgR family response regulator